MLRTRPPRSTPERVRARLACIRHAASVDPEPGSNSPPMIPKDRDAEASWTPKGPGPRKVPDPERSASACDGHALTGLLAVCESERQPQHSCHQEPESTLRSLRLRHPTRCHRQALPPPAIRPRCQLVNVLLPFRSPQSLLHAPSPVKGHGRSAFLLRFRRAIVATWLPRALRSRRCVSQGTP